MDDTNQINQSSNNWPTSGASPLPPTPPSAAMPILEPMLKPPVTPEEPIDITPNPVTPVIETPAEPEIKPEPTTVVNVFNEPAAPSTSFASVTPVDTISSIPSVALPASSEPMMPQVKKNKKNIAVIGGVVAVMLVAVMGAAAYFVSNRLNTQQALAPNAGTKSYANSCAPCNEKHGTQCATYNPDGSCKTTKDVITGCDCSNQPTTRPPVPTNPPATQPPAQPTNPPATQPPARPTNPPANNCGPAPCSTTCGDGTHFSDNCLPTFGSCPQWASQACQGHGGGTPTPSIGGGGNTCNGANTGCPGAEVGSRCALNTGTCLKNGTACSGGGNNCVQCGCVLDAGSCLNDGDVFSGSKACCTGHTYTCGDGKKVCGTGPSSNCTVLGPPTAPATPTPAPTPYCSGTMNVTCATRGGCTPNTSGGYCGTPTPTPTPTGTGGCAVGNCVSRTSTPNSCADLLLVAGSGSCLSGGSPGRCCAEPTGSCGDAGRPICPAPASPCHAGLLPGTDGTCKGSSTYCSANISPSGGGPSEVRSGNCQSFCDPNNYISGSDNTHCNGTDQRCCVPKSTLTPTATITPSCIGGSVVCGSNCCNSTTQDCIASLFCQNKSGLCSATSGYCAGKTDGTKLDNGGNPTSSNAYYCQCTQRTTGSCYCAAGPNITLTPIPTPSSACAGVGEGCNDGKSCCDNASATSRNVCVGPDGSRSCQTVETSFCGAGSCTGFKGHQCSGLTAHGDCISSPMSPPPTTWEEAVNYSKNGTPANCGQADTVCVGGDKAGQACGNWAIYTSGCTGTPPTETPVVTDNPTVPACMEVKVFAQTAASWAPVANPATLQPGTAVRFAVRGVNSTFVKARFKINGGVFVETATTMPYGGFVYYYIDHTLVAGTYTVNAEITATGTPPKPQGNIGKPNWAAATAWTAGAWPSGPVDTAAAIAMVPAGATGNVLAQNMMVYSGKGRFLQTIQIGTNGYNRVITYNTTTGLPEWTGASATAWSAPVTLASVLPHLLPATSRPTIANAVTQASGNERILGTTNKIQQDVWISGIGYSRTLPFNTDGSINWAAVPDLTQVMTIEQLRATLPGNPAGDIQAQYSVENGTGVNGFTQAVWVGGKEFSRDVPYKTDGNPDWTSATVWTQTNTIENLRASLPGAPTTGDVTGMTSVTYRVNQNKFMQSVWLGGKGYYREVPFNVN